MKGFAAVPPFWRNEPLGRILPHMAILVAELPHPAFLHLFGEDGSILTICITDPSRQIRVILARFNPFSRASP
jgi:hypothetical protein